MTIESLDMRSTHTEELTLKWKPHATGENVWNWRKEIPSVNKAPKRWNGPEGRSENISKFLTTFG